MVEIIEIKDRPSANKTTYYKYVEPITATPRDWFGYQLYAFEYRNFLVARTDHEYLLWSIRTKDDGNPPIRLRGHFTSQERAKAAIDQFYREEEAAQTAADEKKRE